MESNDRNDALVRANMESFAAAIDAGRVRVDGPDTPQSIVAVLDGSDQDETTIALLRELSATHAPQITLTCGTLDSGSEDSYVQRAVRELAAPGCDLVLSGKPDNHERILEVLAARAGAWLLLPCPFGHAFRDLAGTTLSTTVEVCLAKSTAPTILVRGPLGAAAREPLVRPHLIVREFDRAAARAARVALGILARGASLEGRLTISFVYGGQPDPDVDDAVAEGFGLEIPQLMPLLGHGLSALLHRLELIAAQHPSLEIHARLAQPGQELIDEDHERGFLHVLPLRPDSTGVPESVHEFVLTTEDVVLVVPAERDNAVQEPHADS